MGNPYKPESPSYYSKLRHDLTTFREAYVRFTNRTAKSIYAGGPIVHDTERSEVMRLSIAASRAVNVSGLLIAWFPPPVHRTSTPPAEGLAAVAFAHESEAYRGFSSMQGPTSVEATVDAVEQADAILAIKQDELAEKRRRPWYWGDRTLRTILGFPGYLVSVLFGFDRYALSAAGGRTLWTLSVVADIAGIAALGRAFGWW